MIRQPSRPLVHRGGCEVWAPRSAPAKARGTDVELDVSTYPFPSTTGTIVAMMSAEGAPFGLPISISIDGAECVIVVVMPPTRRMG